MIKWFVFEEVRILTAATIGGVGELIARRNLGAAMSAVRRGIKDGMEKFHDQIDGAETYDRLMRARGFLTEHGPMDGVGE